MSGLQHRLIHFESMMTVFFHILLISTIFVLIYRKTANGDDKMVFFTFSLLKICCGILIGFLYWSFYGGIGDTIYFYEQAEVLFQYFHGDRISFSSWVGFSPLNLSLAEFSAQYEPRTFFFVRCISFLYAFSQGNYFTMSIYLSFFSGLATWGFAYQLGKCCRMQKRAIYVALLFIPSITFWSSGLLKESLMTMSIYGLGYAVLMWKNNYKNWIYSMPILVCLLVLWQVKYYVPIVLIPILCLALFFSQSNFLSKFRFRTKIALFLALLIIGGLGMALMHPVFNSGRFFELVRISHDVIARNSSVAIIHFQNTENNILFFIKNLPLAWFTGVFRPLVWESFNAFSMLWAIEKGVFTVLVLIASFLSFKMKFNQTEKWWGIAILIYSSILSSVLSLATPNFGTLIRYEVAYMPFLWLLVLMTLNKYKVNLK
ncbi:hypothetical protein [Marivirga harenae]|uniref:hypothetical protein n=1 Tax=Marivirga harenae TaxID=2010992 RepID=UPI0026E0C4B8|nr:hypothetical protein [Marivirga harenae]WKV12044.1 hypothetical protein Q3Y49_17740 [Marivirga harenae]